MNFSKLLQLLRKAVLEGFWWWLVLLNLVLAYAAPHLGVAWLLNPENGFGRLRSYPEIGVLHGSLAIIMLILPSFKNKKAINLYNILAWIIQIIGLFCLMWPGPVATLPFLAFGGFYAITRRNMA